MKWSGGAITEKKTIEITPNYEALGKMMLEDALHKGKSLFYNVSLSKAQRAECLREVQGFMAESSVALMAATSVEEIEKLRDETEQIVKSVSDRARKMESELGVED